jgi:hypothetical protein
MKEKPDNRKIRTTGVLDLNWKGKINVYVSGWIKM